LLLDGYGWVGVVLLFFITAFPIVVAHAKDEKEGANVSGRQLSLFGRLTSQHLHGGAPSSSSSTTIA